jgi:hypothetical protein
VADRSPSFLPDRRLPLARAKPGYVETEFQLYPWAVSWLYRLFGENPLLGRYLSMGCAFAACLVLHRIAARFLPRLPALLATVVFAALPLWVRLSRAFMPEATVMLFYALPGPRPAG